MIETENKFIKEFILICLFFHILLCSDSKASVLQKEKETILIPSFNTLRLGEKEKDYRTLAKILSKYDLIGLQEVMNEKGVKKLVGNIEKLSNEKWNYTISEISTGSQNYKEYYAYIYKKKLFSEVITLGFYQEKNKNEFMREPYGVYFKSGNFDFVLVIAHSIFGDNEKQRLIEGSNYANVYKYFKEKSGEEDIILAGDFNLPADSLAFRNLKLMYNVEYLIDPLKNPTTISDNKLANSYDNFFINKKLTREYTGNHGVHNFIKNNNKEIKEYISDHLLIFSEYSIKYDLDD